MARTRALTIVAALCVALLSLLSYSWLVRTDESVRRTSPNGRSAHAPIAATDLALPPARSVEVTDVSRRSPEDPPAGEQAVATANPTPIAKAMAELEAHSLASLDGVLFVDEVMDRLLEFSSLPVHEHPDLDYGDDDAIAYKLKGVPEGVQAHVLVGMQPYDESGKTFRYLQLHVDDTTNSAYLRDAVRRGTSTSISISYDVTDERKPTRFALLIHRPVDLAASRDAGIDAYSGRFTCGASYAVDLLKDPDDPKTGTFGLVDGNTQDATRFAGVSPLAGDVHLDANRLALMLEHLQKHLSTIRGE